MCYDGMEVGVTSHGEVWVLEGHWVWRCGVFLWLVGFSRASKILFVDMECLLFRWLFLENLHE